MKPEPRILHDEALGETPVEPVAARSAPAATVLALPRPPRLHVIYNPTAGRRRRKLFNRTIRALSLAGCHVSVSETQGPDAATSIASAQASGDRDVLAIAGGDGTVNEALNGIVGRNVALAVIPLGTANVLANEIGLRPATESIVRTIAEGEARPVDLGRIVHPNGTRHFIMMAGAGFDARVVASVGKRLRKWTGKFAYVWGSLVEIARYRPVTYRVTVDGEAYEAASVVVANGRYYGGRFVLASDARLDDGRLHVCLFLRPGRWRVIRYACFMALGLLRRLNDYAVLPAREVRIEGPAGEPVQADGDLVAELPVTIRLAGDTLTLIHPSRT